MSRLSRRDQVAGEALSALRSADGPARLFLLHLLGGSVAGGGGVDSLHHLRGVSAVEPDALKGIASRQQKWASLRTTLKEQPCVSVSKRGTRWRYPKGSTAGGKLIKTLILLTNIELATPPGIEPGLPP